jgi:hypothetical protein
VEEAKGMRQQNASQRFTTPHNASQRFCILAFFLSCLVDAMQRSSSSASAASQLCEWCGGAATQTTTTSSDLEQQAICDACHRHFFRGSHAGVCLAKCATFLLQFQQLMCCTPLQSDVCRVFRSASTPQILFARSAKSPSSKALAFLDTMQCSLQINWHNTELQAILQHRQQQQQQPTSTTTTSTTSTTTTTTTTPPIDDSFRPTISIMGRTTEAKNALLAQLIQCMPLNTDFDEQLLYVATSALA